MTDSQYHIRYRTTKVNDLYKKEPAIDTVALNKMYIGKVRDTRDPQNMGRILVWIPELFGDGNDPEGWYVASYCSPFAGASFLDNGQFDDKLGGSSSVAFQRNITDPDRQPENTPSAQGGRQSYGMWMTQPDVGNSVIVTFVRGDSTRCIWMGSLFDQKLNHMVPGIASAPVLPQTADEDQIATDDTDGPAIETDYNGDKGLTNYKNDVPERLKYSPLFHGLKRQGLNTDNQRGTTTSSARRESPSQVFGILTPNGNQFVLDDGTENYTTDPSHPGGNALIRLRTKSGTQLLLDETSGNVYAISRDGKTWIELNNDGNIDIYGKTNISVHAETGNINLKTSGETGDVNIQSGRDINIEAERNLRIEVGGETDILSSKDISIATLEKFNLISLGDMSLEVRNDNFGLTVAQDINIQTPGGKLTAASDDTMSLFSNNKMDINATSDLAMSSGGAIGITSSDTSTVYAGGDVNLEGGNVNFNSGKPMGPQPSNVDPAGPSPEEPVTAATYNNVPSQATTENVNNGPWEAGDPYEENANIVPRVPQHEPWGGRATTDATGTNGQVVPTETNAKEGSTQANASKPDDYIDKDGNHYSGTYDASGKPSYFLQAALSSPGLVNPPNLMSSSSDTKEIIKKYETPSSSVTSNASGQPTIGYGHTLTEKEIEAGTYDDAVLSQQEMDDLLDQDIAEAEKSVQSSVKQPVTQGQFDAMTSLSANIGPQEFANSEVVKSVNLQKLKDTPTLFTQWSSVRTPSLPNIPSIPTFAGMPNISASTIVAGLSSPSGSGNIITQLPGLINRRADEAKLLSKTTKPPSF